MIQKDFSNQNYSIILLVPPGQEEGWICPCPGSAIAMSLFSTPQCGTLVHVPWRAQSQQMMLWSCCERHCGCVLSHGQQLMTVFSGIIPSPTDQQITDPRLLSDNWWHPHFPRQDGCWAGLLMVLNDKVMKESQDLSALVRPLGHLKSLCRAQDCR